MELAGEKSRLGRGSNWGHGGGICASGAPNEFSRSSEAPHAPIHYSEEPENVPQTFSSPGKQGRADPGGEARGACVDELETGRCVPEA